jgi:hypothetical protein
MRSINLIATRLRICMLVFILSACSAVEASPPTQQFPTGNFKAVNPLFAEEIRFFDNGTYAVRFVGEPTWDNAYRGTYTISGDQLVFDDPETECANHPGTYTWSFDGTTLTLKVVEDTCTALPRAEDLGHAWTKQSTLTHVSPTVTLMILATETPASTSTLAPTASFTSPAPTYTPGGPFPTGTYEPIRVLYINKLEFREDGTFRYTLDGGGAVSGTYVLDSNQIVLNESQIGPCAGFPGTYKWSFDGNTLYLKAIEDKCPLPHKLPLQRGWVKQP